MGYLSEEDIKPVVNEFQATVEVPKVEYVEKIVEVPEIEYVDVPVERIVEVPKYVEEYVEKIVNVPRFVKKPVPTLEKVEVPFEINRKVPVPVEAEIECDMRINILQPKYNVVSYEVTVPRYIEVPVPREILSASEEQQFNEHIDAVKSVVESKEQVPLSRLEEVTNNAINFNVLGRVTEENLRKGIEKAISENRISLKN